MIFCLKFARVHVTIFIYIRSCGICAPHISHLILSEMSHIFILLLFNYTKHWTPYETSHSTSPYLCCVLSLAAINIINSGKYFRSICKVSTWEISDKIRRRYVVHKWHIVQNNISLYYSPCTLVNFKQKIINKIITWSSIWYGELQRKV